MSRLERIPATDSQGTAPGPRHAAKVGVIGAGQLARMTLRAAIDMDVELTVLAAHGGQPAARAGARWVKGEADDIAAALALAEGKDAVTFDHELVPDATVAALLEAGADVSPNPAALALAKDKIHARTVLADLGFPVPRFATVASAGDVERFATEVGWPIVLKASSGGYDGRGVWVADGLAAAERLLDGGGTWLAEEHVAIAKEISVLVARNRDGHSAVYPIIETRQEDGICRELLMPAAVEDGLAEEARRIALSLVDGIDGCGITAVEMFVTTDDRILICEVATRPHNSGHATIEGCVTSQFHNHLRGVLGWPLGSTDLMAPAVAMVNVLGSDDGMTPKRLPDALAVEGVNVHLYGKTELPGRKIGHVTAIGRDADEALDRARTAAAVLGGR